MDPGTGYSVLIRNLRYYTTPDYVRERFEVFGKVRDVYLPLDYATRRPRGFGFVEYYEKQDALDAIKSMDNTEFDGGVIACFFAQDRRKSPESMRRAYNANSSRYNGSSHSNYPPRSGYYEPRYRSRSRSPPRGRRSPSYPRRYTPYDRPRHYSPPRYHREYRPSSRYDRDYPPPPRYPRDPRDPRDPREPRQPPRYDRYRDYHRPSGRPESPRQASPNRDGRAYSRERPPLQQYSHADESREGVHHRPVERETSVDRLSVEMHQPPLAKDPEERQVPLAEENQERATAGTRRTRRTSKNA